ncbi:S41 family peptidase [Flavobacterium sp. 102]|uniref:S41 family peptidase n=1 Tax=Flavobacterium sp. 102 TaxID=2135623 RepID=UPI000EB52845|nr:S41 family peptidase [Flavobacterium sp. 102]RKS01309.1 peptidase S41-like protein [Flavobacterium sp. 102]
MHTNTKMKRLVLHSVLILLFNFAVAQKNPSHFKSEIDFGNGTAFSTFLDVTIAKDQFTITSPKNADVRIFGGKAKLGRMLGKSPKKGIIITISGQQKNDSLFGDSNIPMVGKLKFKGIIKDETLSAALLNEDGIAIGTIRGISSTENKIDYSYLYPMLLKTVQDNIYSPAALQTQAWKKFENDIKKLSTTAHDDIEMYFGFNILAQQLPFSHLSLTIAQEATDNEETAITPKSVVFEEKNSTTAYLQIKNFSNSTPELAATLPQIVANPNYKNLIIDLRNNPGGGIEAAFEFAKHITDSDMEVGYFLTNKLQYTGYQPELFKTLPELQPKGTKDFTDELKASPGVKLIFKKPTNPVFTGNIYVLTNGKTGSTCEPIVYALKNSKRATIVGEKTAGAMLAASPFVVSGKYMLILPIADFYTYDGIRLDRVGVNPDIEVKSEEALNKVLEIITGGKS